MQFNRHNKNFIYSWWWTIDRFMLIAVLMLLVFGFVIAITASPAVADRIGVDSYFFVKRQAINLIIAFMIILLFSFFTQKQICLLSFIGIAVFTALILIVLIIGTEVKGAKRWIYILGFSIQPSELVKPFFAVCAGYLLSLKTVRNKFPSFQIVTAIYLVIILLLFLQPDFGMIVTISAIWGGMMFLAGLNMLWIFAMVLFSAIIILTSYIFLPHVAKRINSFLNPTVNENYQVNKSLEAFLNGGFFGKGPAEGTVKQFLPDSHTDFIFAVIGEELGIITCLFLVCLYCFLIIRGLYRISEQTNLFAAYSVGGLLMLLAMQTIINIGVTLNIFPTKGMTLPFLSYGGSSMLANAITVGIILALTRREYGMLYKHKFRKML